MLLNLGLHNYTALEVSGSDVSCGKPVSLTDQAWLVWVSTVLTIEDETVFFFPTVIPSDKVLTPGTPFS